MANIGRLVAIGTILALLLLSGVAIASPRTFNVVPLEAPLVDQTTAVTYYNITTYGGFLGLQKTTTEYEVSSSMLIQQSPGTPTQWSNDPTGVYSVSVPSGALATEAGVSPQSTTATIQIRYYVNGVEQTGSTNAEFTVDVAALYESTSGYQNFEIPYNGGGGQTVYQFTATDTGSYTTPAWFFDQNATNSFNSMSGIVNFGVNIAFTQAGTNYKMPNMYAQQYVVPGTGTFNLPSQTAQVGQQTNISGTMNYGTYALQITSPTGQQQTVNLGSNAKLNTPFNYGFTPTQLGIYTVVLTNTMVGLTQTQLISVKQLLTQAPTIVIKTTTSTGYYLNGQTINFEIIEPQNGTNLANPEFNLLIYNGNQEPVSGTGNFYIDGNVQATLTNGNYTYSGSFTINPNGQALGTISIVATFITSGYSAGSQATHISIRVGYQSVTVPTYLAYEIGIIALIAAGLVAGFDRTDLILRYAVFGMGIATFVIFFVVGAGIIV
jgi:hypothetical protein